MFSNHKWIRISVVIFPVLMFVPVWNSCDDSTSTGSGELKLSSSAVVAGDCKVFDELKAADSHPSDQDCLEYAIDDQGKLQITHFNAGFNCCPDSFAVEVSMDNGLITIVESEDLTSGGCHCLCLFDLEYSISGLESREYTIQVVEPYVSEAEDDPLLRFSVNLATTPSGSFCVNRDSYPWGTVYTPQIVSTTSGDCKADSAGNLAASQLSLECIQYTYDGVSLLSVDHINVVFNCCVDSLSAAVRMAADTIIIEETEYLSAGGGCDCICPFDLSYGIDYLPPGQYTVRIIGPYTDPISFDIDLLSTPSDSYCPGGQGL